MISRILLAVDNTPDSVAAARVAVELAAALRATLRIVHVSTNHNLDAATQTDLIERYITQVGAPR